MRQETNLSSEKPLAVVASTVHADGYDLAKQFAEHGYDIIVAAKNPSVVEEAQDLKELGADAVSFQLDLSTTEGVEQLYRRIIATGRPVEAMVVNSDMTELAQKVLKDMASRGHGRILFAGNNNEEENNLACEAVFEEARGTGVTVTAVKTGSHEIYFLKEGYEDSSAETLLH